MKKLLLCVLTLALALSLASCAPDTAEVTPTPEPIPTPTARPAPTSTPEPTPEPTPPPMTVDEFLADLEDAFSGPLQLWANYYVFQDSNYLIRPHNDDDGFREAVYALLTSLDWQENGDEGWGAECAPDGYEFLITFSEPHDDPYGLERLVVRMGSDVVTWEPPSASGRVVSGFRADGAEELGKAIVALESIPHVHYNMSVPVADTPEETMERYIQAFQESWLASGHITDFRVDRAELCSQGEHVIYFYFAYSFKYTGSENWRQISDIFCVRDHDGYTYISSLIDPEEYMETQQYMEMG